MPKQKLKVFKRQWMFFGLVVIFLFLLVGLNARLVEYFRLTDQKKEMVTRIDNLQSTREALATQIAFADSEKAVEEWARTYERKILPGDQPIIPLPAADVTPEVDYLKSSEQQEQKKWVIWWELFFD